MFILHIEGFRMIYRLPQHNAGDVQCKDNAENTISLTDKNIVQCGISCNNTFIHDDGRTKILSLPW
jgi:hypothetical protein